MYSSIFDNLTKIISDDLGKWCKVHFSSTHRFDFLEDFQILSINYSKTHSTYFATNFDERTYQVKNNQHNRQFEKILICI